MVSQNAHILLCSLSVAVPVDADLAPSPDSPESIENKIVTQLRSLGPPGTEHQQEEIATKINGINGELEKLGVTIQQLVLAPKNSIKSYIICESEEQLRQLREHYESGLMKYVLERIFSLLAGQQVIIDHLWWRREEYQKCQQEFSELRSKSLYLQMAGGIFHKIDMAYVGSCHFFNTPLKCLLFEVARWQMQL